VRPWLLDVDGPGRLPVLDSSERLRTLTAAVLADPAHRAALSTVDAAWTPDTAIHGDVRFANVLIRPLGDALLVDWESSGHGDADWDVAGGVQEYVSAGGVFPTSPAVAAFLAGYARGSGRPVDSARLAAFVACRLLVRAWQLTNWLPDPASEVERHRALARAVLQTGGNR
jgi:aminoglycoside phosphotransferase (APT) family kinase protein